MTRLGPDGERQLRERLTELAAEGEQLPFEDFPQNRHGATGLSTEFADWYPRVSQLIRWAFEGDTDAFRAVQAADHRLDRIFGEPAGSFHEVQDLYLRAIQAALAALDGPDPPTTRRTPKPLRSDMRPGGSPSCWSTPGSSKC